MRTVWKYDTRIGDWHQHMIPEGGKLLHVDRQMPNSLTAWFEVETANLSEEWRMIVVGTGQPIVDQRARHLGTGLDGAFVWHLYGYRVGELAESVAKGV